MYELRLLLLHGSFLVISIIAGMYSLFIGDISRLVLCLIIVVTLTPIVLLKNKIKFYDDFCVLYAWKFFAILPIVVEYDSIINVTKKSNRCVKVEHQFKNSIYVFSSDKFINELNKKVK